jgi:hypothetical protein
MAHGRAILNKGLQAEQPCWYRFYRATSVCERETTSKVAGFRSRHIPSEKDLDV